MEYDYIIAGAGSAGCVLANRLSADRSCNVLLLEAGGSNESIFIDMPSALSIPMNRRRFNWGFESQPEPHMDDRRLHCPRGRGLGGSSSINGMVYVRGHARDFDHWAESGADGWHADAVRPFFDKAEQMLRPRTGSFANPLYEAFLQAGEQAGHERSANLNGTHQEGVGPLAMTVHNGRRQSAKRAYLEPAMQRHNLHIIRHALADRVVFEGTRAVGLEWSKHGKRRTSRAAQVILCAGAIGSPAILQRSGIGDENHLSALGIPVVAHRPAVGQNLSDHLEVYIQQSCREPVSLHSWLNPLGKAWIGATWLMSKTGLGATNHFETGGFIRSDGRALWTDIQFHFLPAAMHYDGSQVAAEHGYQIHAGPMLPESRGTVRIQSADARTAPHIQFNYLSTQRDREVFRLSIAHARSIFAQPAFADLRGEELAPGSHVQSDDEVDAWVRENAESAYHPCGTCRMGAAENSVTDSQGRVHGTAGLRVVDASIFPSITNGNLNAPTIMCAEKIADAIAG